MAANSPTLLLSLTNTDVWAITVGVVGLAVIMLVIAIARSMRDKGVRTTRFGFYIERDRYGGLPLEPDEQVTEVKWPEKTKDGV